MSHALPLFLLLCIGPLFTRAVGSSAGTVALIGVQYPTLIYTFQPHTTAVQALQWHQHILSVFFFKLFMTASVYRLIKKLISLFILIMLWVSVLESLSGRIESYVGGHVEMALFLLPSKRLSSKRIQITRMPFSLFLTLKFLMYISWFVNLDQK